MIILDTCALIFDALTPDRLSKHATTELDRGRAQGTLACSDISLWEIAMLISKNRLKPAMPPKEFISDLIAANRLRVLPITPEIACIASFNSSFTHADPADRIIAATAMCHKSSLLTCDDRLQNISGLETIW